MNARVIETIDAACRKATQAPQFSQVLEQYALVPMYMYHTADSRYTRCLPT